MKATLEINGITLEITGDSPKELIPAFAFWQSLPSSCPMCGSDLQFTYRTPQDYTYYGLICANLHACNFGQSKDTKSLFYKNEWKDVREFRNDEQTAEMQGYKEHPNAPKAQAAREHLPAQRAGYADHVQKSDPTEKIPF